MVVTLVAGGTGLAGVVCWGTTVVAGPVFAGTTGNVLVRCAGFGVCAAVVEAGPSSEGFDCRGVVVTAVVGATAGVVCVLTTGGAGDCATSAAFGWRPNLVVASTIVPAATTSKSPGRTHRSGRRRRGVAGRRRRIVGVRRQSSAGSYAPPETGAGAAAGWRGGSSGNNGDSPVLMPISFGTSRPPPARQWLVRVIDTLLPAA